MNTEMDLKKETSVNLKDSLREIASLLMMIHDHYFKTVIGIQDTLSSLIRFVDDVGMSTSVSIIDIEVARNKCTLPSSPVFDSNCFYEWLKTIANTVFYNAFKDEKKNLYFVLVTYLLPFASNSENIFNKSQQLRQKNQMYAELVISANLNTIMSYSAFLKTVFASIVSNGNFNVS